MACLYFILVSVQILSHFILYCLRSCLAWKAQEFLYVFLLCDYVRVRIVVPSILRQSGTIDLWTQTHVPLCSGSIDDDVVAIRKAEGKSTRLRTQFSSTEPGKSTCFQALTVLSLSSNEITQE